MRALITAEDAVRRLRLIFPREAFDVAASNSLAGWAIASLIYVEAVADTNPQTWARPSTVLWQREPVLAEHGSDHDRARWRAAAARGASAVDALLREWGVPETRRYAENSREPLRDDTFRLWAQMGAMRQRHGIPTSSSQPRWALEPHFADLFDPAVDGDALDDAITAWREAHMDAGALLRAAIATRTAKGQHATTVTLPDGTERPLEPGVSSQILKGVIEQWAPVRLGQPIVLVISEPGAKLLVTDQLILTQLGITLDVSNLLPDALLADLATEPVTFWVIEAVATDGAITEQRKRELEQWAPAQRIRVDSLRFLTAFVSRNQPAAKRRLKDLAVGTYAWFSDEPQQELAWYALSN